MATKKDEKDLAKDINTRGTAAARSGGSKGDHHTYTRQNPVTGVIENGVFPASEHKDRTAEGWKTLDDVVGDSVGESDKDAPAAPGTVANSTAR